jgi:arylformamidase
VFFHGGYWRAFDKADYSFVARSIVEAGAIAVIANYGLMPTISMAELIAQCQRLICWVYEHAERLGADPRCISVSGHSAGAHIATVLHFTTWGAHGMPADLIKSTVAVSGIFDLGPVFHSFLRAETGINAENVARFSPMSWLGREENHRAPLLLAVGADETEEFQRQSAEFSLVLHTMGINSPVLRIGRRHHMDIVLDLGDASSELGRNLVRHIQTI